jgi:hypothetical protein
MNATFRSEDAASPLMFAGRDSGQMLAFFSPSGFEEFSRLVGNSDELEPIVDRLGGPQIRL